MHPRNRFTSPRLAALAVAVGAVALAAPSAANATVTAAATGNVLTITSDQASDNITLGVNAAGQLALGAQTDFDPDPGVVRTLPSDGSIAVAVDAGDGNDNVNLSAPNLAPSTIAGGGGDDIIVGSNAVDAISGGDGNDRITGFKGNETILGDAGNDTIVWNNGDGNDIDDGGAGVDETLVTEGNADDQTSVTQQGARTHLERSNAPFSVDSDNMEKLTITSFSGNDVIATGADVPLAMNVDAGPGDDTITTGAGNDLVQGGDGNDTLNGTAGGDRLVGDRGADTMNGGAGDDTMVWNNGDGSDAINGEDGVDRVEDNLSGGVDVSTLKLEGGRVRYDRTNVGQFSLSVASSEVFALNSLGGDDTLDVSPGIGMQVVADAGAGNDKFNGADEPDAFFGGAGDDTLSGGAGNDSVDGQDGNDTLAIRDSAADFARGGAGTDKATADEAAVDAVAADVESIDRTATATPPAAGTGVVARSAKVKKGVASITVSCPGGTAGCKGTVTLVSAKSIKVGKLKAKLVLGSAGYSLGAGQSRTIKVRLAPGTAKLAKKKKLAVSARVTSAVAEQASKVTLRF